MQSIRHQLLSPSPGTQREVVSLHYGKPGGLKAYIQASLHGDELPGMLVVHHLRKQLDALEAAEQIHGEIVLVPMANPIGLNQYVLDAHQGRFDMASGENFNRHFPDLADAVAEAVEAQLGDDASLNVAILRRKLKEVLQDVFVATELESQRRTLMSLACDADIVLDLHCDAQALLHLYTETNCWPACEPLTRFLGSRLTLLSQDSADNPFDETCSKVWRKWGHYFDGRFPIPQACISATVELRGAMDINHSLALGDAKNIIDYLQWRGLVAGEKRSIPDAIGDARPLSEIAAVKAPKSGLLTVVKSIGTEVKAGDVLAHIIDPITAEVVEVTCPKAGLLFGSELPRLVSANARVASIASLEKIGSGKLLIA